MTEISEIQQLKNDLLLLTRKVESSNMPDQAFVSNISHINARINTIEIQLNEFRNDFARVIGNKVSQDHLKKVVDLDERFSVIEKFIKYLLDYFDPNKKMQLHIGKLNKTIKEQEIELNTIKDRVKGLLK